MDLILRGGRVIDPSQGLDGIRDVGFADGKLTFEFFEASAGALPKPESDGDGDGEAEKAPEAAG